MRLLYLVHDLDDAAVKRRLRFLRDGGADVAPIGFRRDRDGTVQDLPEGLVIGRTQNGRMLRRILSTARAVAGSGRWHHELPRADIVISRSLEMLLLAVVVRHRVGATTPIVYECLDIHRLMTRPDRVGKLLRWIERRLLDRSSLLVVSSPRFVEDYFVRVHARLPPWRLLENKLLPDEVGAEAGAGIVTRSLPDTTTWRIGWFGIIRCQRSLDLLAALAGASNGRIVVDIRGRVAHDVIPDFEACIAATPGLTFGGPYDRATDLATLYGGVHFNWAIDLYEDGLNSAWLLPNRLYEGSIFGSVPLALRSVETGRWLARHGCGLLLDQPLDRTLPALFASMTDTAYQAARNKVAALDRTELLETAATAAAFVSTLMRLGSDVPATRLNAKATRIP